MWLYCNIFYNCRLNELYEEEKLYKNLCLQNKIVIDIGADIGVYTMFFATSVSRGKVLAFEPNPLSFYFLCKNIKINNFKNVTPINLGLSNKVEKLQFALRRYNRAKGSFKKDKQQLMIVSYDKLFEKEIQVITLDKAIEKYSIQHVDFIKIDTEGFEPYVIEGMSGTISRFAPTIYFEIHGLNPQQKQHDLRRIFNFFNRYEYEIIIFENGLT